MEATRNEPVRPTPGQHRLNLRVLRFRTDPDREEPALLAHALLESGRSIDALELTTAGLARDPSDVDLRMVHGLSLAARGRLKESQLALTKVAQEAPDWADAWRHLAAVLLRRGRVDQALSVAERALVLEPGDPETAGLVKEARLASRAQRFVERPDSEEPALLARELLCAGRFAEALEVTRSALVHEVDDADLLLAHARAAHALGDLDEACNALRTATFTAPDWAEPWHQLAALELERGSLDEALEAAHQAVDLDPSREEARALAEKLAREVAHRQEVELASVIVDLS